MLQRSSTPAKPGDDQIVSRTSGRSPRYGTVAILFHWVTAILVLGLLLLGFYMKRVEDDLFARFEIYQLHKSLGFTLLVVMLLRLAWRATHDAPCYPQSMPSWMKQAASMMHRTLYVVLIIVPLSGWAMVSTAAINIPTLYFGWFEIPHLPLPSWYLAEDPATTLHTVLVVGLGLLAMAHIAAALYHTLILKDGTLNRMLPAWRTNGRGRNG